ncbi:hypothetical protein PTI98_006160 [Pleurotus ostreatus]|nr:hypothetical protein PTI98_006160 [Pleurotus ostreatus]
MWTTFPFNVICVEVRFVVGHQSYGYSCRYVRADYASALVGPSQAPSFSKSSMPWAIRLRDELNSPSNLPDRPTEPRTYASADFFERGVLLIYFHVDVGVLGEGDGTYEAAYTTPAE